MFQDEPIATIKKKGTNVKKVHVGPLGNLMKGYPDQYIQDGNVNGFCTSTYNYVVM